VLARVNLAAIQRNCELLRSRAGGAALCAVVKADGYGHGAAASARAALAGGASWLAVADASEAEALRRAGLQSEPIVVMGALTGAEMRRVLELGCDVVIWSERQLAEVAAAGGGRVHVKFDSGMGRLGTRDGAEAAAVADRAAALAGVTLAGLMTHFATADESDDGGFLDSQLGAFTEWAAPIAARHPDAIVHAANSAATLREPAAHLDMVRCGIAMYGIDPFGHDAADHGLEPALELGSYVAEVKLCAAGQSAGYGRRFIATQDTMIGVVPVGYGDGWRRGLSGNADVLVGGARRAVAGTVSMDSMTVVLGDAGTERGAPVVLIGADGDQRITAEEIARRLQTISYEVTCGLTARVPRIHHRDGAPVQG
jgi:alanine racemase